MPMRKTSFLSHKSDRARMLQKKGKKLPSIAILIIALLPLKSTTDHLLKT